MGVHTHVFKFMKDVCFKGFMKKIMISKCLNATPVLDFMIIIFKW